MRRCERIEGVEAAAIGLDRKKRTPSRAGLAGGYAIKNVAVHGQILAVLMMTLVADGVSDVVKQLGSFKNHPRFAGKMMQRLQLIKKPQAEFANVFGVTLVAFQTP